MCALFFPEVRGSGQLRYSFTVRMWCKVTIAAPRNAQAPLRVPHAIVNPLREQDAHAPKRALLATWIRPSFSSNAFRMAL